MCLILFAKEQHPDYRLILLSNRDEFYARKTAAAAWWQQPEGILGGRDLEKGGTWLGINKNGKWAALTNYRAPAAFNPEAPSRGKLVNRFLETDEPPETFFSELKQTGGQYNGFNLLLGYGTRIFYYSNVTNTLISLENGLYGLSNALLDTEWVKLTKGKRKMQKLLDNEKFDSASAFRLMHDTEVAPDSALPQTGVPLNWERALSPMFIETEKYGTRTTSLLCIGYDNTVCFKELNVKSNQLSEFQFTIE